VPAAAREQADEMEELSFPSEPEIEEDWFPRNRETAGAIVIVTATVTVIAAADRSVPPSAGRNARLNVRPHASRSVRQRRPPRRRLRRHHRRLLVPRVSPTRTRTSAAASYKPSPAGASGLAY